MAAKGGVLDAQAFVENYYSIVGTATHEAHELYADASLVTRPGPDGTMMSFSSPEAIEKHYLSSYYDGTTFDVLSVDTQSSSGDGLFIMVVGFLNGKDNLKRKFSQGFYLARPNGVYAVVNDIQRFVDEESSTPRALPATVSGMLPKTAQVHKGTKKKSVNASEVKKVVAAEKAFTAQKPKEPAAETSATPPVDGAKKSYASMIQSMSSNAAPLQVKAAPVQIPSSVAVAQPKPHVAPAPKKKSDHKVVDEPGTSIFVSNLPMDARWPEVHELFKGFGTIKERGVQIIHSRDSGRCFGFIAFESVASVQSVLKAAKSTPFWLGDYKLRVREKQVAYDGSKSQSGSVDGSKPSGGRSEGGSKTQSGSVDGSKTRSGSADGSKSQSGSVEGSKTQSGSADGSKTENGSVASLEEDGFTLVRSRRNRREKH